MTTVRASRRAARTRPLPPTLHDLARQAWTRHHPTPPARPRRTLAAAPSGRPPRMP